MVRPNELRCHQCGAFHSGTMSANVCPDCYSKGFR